MHKERLIKNNNQRKIKMIDIYRDPVWEDMMNWMLNPFGERNISGSGLKTIIKRPHNLINVTDDNGEVVAQRLEVVTTPFKKDDVKVSVLDNILSVNCGSENIKDETFENAIYRGISNQSYTFSLKLAPSIDQTKITAENSDGVLKINLPLKQKEIVKHEPTMIEVK